MSFEYTTLTGLKSLARKIQAEQGIPYHQALELTARHGGFAGYVDAKRKLPEQRAARFDITIRQNWWGYESRDGGTAEITLRLKVPLAELVRPHHLTGYLGACRIRDAEIIERSGQQRHASETQWYIGRIARALQFMDTTGLRPSDARRCYPQADWENRPPVADHDHCWFDPLARAHILSTEPYPGRSERAMAEQAAWEKRHGWQTFCVNWGGIYGNGTELILCCPQAYAETLKGKIALLEAAPAAVGDDDVIIYTYPPIPRTRSMIA